MPTAVGKAGGHRATAVGTVAVDAVIGDVQLATRLDGFRAALVWIVQLKPGKRLHHARLDVLGVRDEAACEILRGPRRHLLYRARRLLRARVAAGLGHHECK